VANVANNHFLDYGQDAAADTLRALRDNNMAYLGATGIAANGQPLTLQTRGGALALLGFAPCAHPLPGSTHINVATGRGADLAGTVSQAKRNADVVIISLHQGQEYSRYVLPGCRKLARHLVAAGADCVICHHGHVIQPLEVHGHGLVFHGTGNFLIDVDSRRRPDAALTLALRVHLNSGRIRHVSVEPFEINQFLQPCPLDGRERDGVRERFARLSESLSSPAGSFRNNLSARAAWLADRLLAVSATVGRAGMREAMAYYCRRLRKPR
jgi:poly-gamma-glutamate synthesis protein (capsule biosynthesis protein)